ncbi:hypothetical protein [Tropicimonas sp. S265A]|uniref:hypothetical protein n=1 Tax=Tropicimonas sp. S265A TaxID=3415134 RepID=UPI003C7D4E3D
MSNTQASNTPKAKEATADVVDTAMAELNESSKKAKHHVADHAEAQADSFAEASQAFSDNPYARQAAEHVSETLTQFAYAVRTADLGTLQHDVTDFARRNPALFFGGAAVLGFIAARAMKASERAETPDWETPSAPATPRATHGNPMHGDYGSNQWGRV